MNRLVVGRLTASPAVAAAAAAGAAVLSLLWFLRKSARRSRPNESVLGLAELTKACELWERELAGARDEERKRRLRKLLWQAYGALDTLYEISGRSRGARNMDHDDGAASACSSDSFMSVSNLEFAHGADYVQEAQSELIGGERIPMTHSPTDITLNLTEELPDIPPIVADERPYESGLARVRQGEVRCRKIRLSVSGCTSDDDFLACVHGIRHAFHMVLSRVDERTWLRSHGQNLLCKLLARAERPSERFATAFGTILDYVTNSLTADGGASILAELENRKVAALSFYDLVLDFTFLDALEDLENPPAALTTAMNAWVPAVVKQKMLVAAVGVVISAKRGRADPQGFMTKYYDVMEEVSPVIAWGLLGSDERLKQSCTVLKDTILAFTGQLFRLTRQAATLGELADSVLEALHRSSDTITRMLNQP
eukprot:m.231870 g.231870  ORF g.231870 m.231870 type:complete len:427 (+) comp12272_c0_seq1:1291-2571(+)